MKPFSFPAYCEERGLSYHELAKTLGISHSYACQLRLGTTPMTLKVARKINKVLGLPLDMLLNNDGIRRKR